MKGSRFIILMTPTGGIVYLLRQDFTSNIAAPLTSPASAEPGPGILTYVQVDGQFSQSAGAMQFPAQATVTFGDQVAYESVGRSRVAGRALLFSVNLSAAAGNGVLFGWWKSTTFSSTPNAVDNFYLRLSTLLTVFPTNVSIGSFAVATVYQCAHVLRSAGTFLFIKGGTFTNWTLLWIGVTDNTAIMYPAMNNGDGAGALDYFLVRDLPAPFTTDDGIAVVNVSTPTTGTVQTSVADAVNDFAFTVSGSPAAGDIYSIKYNILDANNYNIAYIKRNAGNTNYDFLLDKVVAGATTNLIAAVTNVGNVDLIRVIHKGSTHNCFTKVTTAWSLRGSVTDANQSTSTGLSANFAVGTSISLKSYATSSAVYNELSNT